MSRSLITADLTIKVSSTLDKSVSKKCLIDGNPETCWTSGQGTPQFIQLTFPNLVIPDKILLTFQGGFVGAQTAIHALDSSGDLKLLVRIFPEDVNRRQEFPLPKRETRQMKIVFEQTSDFFGRITIYELDIEGSVIISDIKDNAS